MCKKSYSKYTYISSTVKKKEKKDAERKLIEHWNLQKYEHVFIKWTLMYSIWFKNKMTWTREGLCYYLHVH